MREEVRSWLIQEKVGLISSEELISLVDSKISELDNPPDYLTSISLGCSLSHESRLDLVKEPLIQEDCVLVAAKMLSLFNEGKITLDDIGLYSLKICSLLGSQDGVYIDFSWIDDEVYLVNEGIKDRSESTCSIVDVLNGIAKT